MKNQEQSDRIFLHIDADASWYQTHFRNSIIDSFKTNAKNVASKSFFGSVENRPQPKEWTLEEYNPDVRKDGGTQLLIASNLKCDESNTNIFNKWNPIEYLAWHVPDLVAVDENHYQFGIHFSEPNMVGAFNSIDFGIDHWFCKYAFIQTIFAHETCHAWVEALVYHSYFFEGASNPSANLRTILSNFGGYIAVEEAICNTAAFGWVTWFTKRAVQDKIISQSIGDSFIKAIKEWMSSQPKGYRDFKDNGELPISSNDFLSDISKLLKMIYHVPNSENSVSAFFNSYHQGGFHSKLPINLPRVIQSVSSKTSSNNIGSPLWRINAVPIYWHTDAFCFLAKEVQDFYSQLWDNL